MKNYVQTFLFILFLATLLLISHTSYASVTFVINPKEELRVKSRTSLDTWKFLRLAVIAEACPIDYLFSSFPQQPTTKSNFDLWSSIPNLSNLRSISMAGCTVPKTVLRLKIQNMKTGQVFESSPKNAWFVSSLDYYLGEINTKLVPEETFSMEEGD